jgi:putative colanic acid biosysnthesis UDP-glucose lipid carrier transferase
MISQEKTDFLSIKGIFHYIVSFVIPLISAIVSLVIVDFAFSINGIGELFGGRIFFTGELPVDLGVETISWPIVVIMLYIALIVKFDLHKLAKSQNYTPVLLALLFQRAALATLLALIALGLNESGNASAYKIVAWGIVNWLVASLLTAATIEISVMQCFRKNPKIVAIAAMTDSSIAFANSFKSNRFLGIKFVGFFEDRPSVRLPIHGSFEILGKFNEIAGYLENNRVDHIFVSLPTQATYRFQSILEQFLDTTCSVHYLHDFLLFPPIRQALTPVGSVSVFTIIDSPSSGVERGIKRCFDIICSGLAIVVLSPLMLVVAAWIKINSKGPALFKQKRGGAGAETFYIYKFRSMTMSASFESDSSGVVQQAKRGDARVTSVGAFIRRTSIDELPQLINILKGDMSIVGPRPHAISHNQEYRLMVRGYMLRHKMKPGLTGLAQVNGYRGETDTWDKMNMRVQYDLEYLRNWSFWLDIKIILQTVKMVITGKNAY